MEIQSKLIRWWIAGILIILACASAQAQQTVFHEVWVRFPHGDHLIEKGADLILDDTLQKLIVKSGDKPIELRYDDVQRVVFDATTHMRGSSKTKKSLLAGIGAALPLPLDVAVAATQVGIEGALVTDYWFYFEYKMPDGTSRPYMLEIDKSVSHEVVTKIQSIFGDKVKVWDFPERAQIINKNQLPELNTKHSVTMDKKNHPVLMIRPEQALIVVVCPAIGTSRGGNQFKIHANGHVVAVNEAGTYSFFFLDPGDYLLVSQSQNASGIQITLEGGKDYYFIQNALSGTLKNATALSRNTKEIVMYELQGTYFSDWQQKK